MPRSYYYLLYITSTDNRNVFWNCSVDLDRLCDLVVRVPATDPEVRFRFPELPHFLRSTGSGTGSTQSREYNWGATWKKGSGSGQENQEYGCRDSSRWPRGTLYPLRLALTSVTSCGYSVGIVRSRTQATEFSFSLVLPVKLVFVHSLHYITAKWRELYVQSFLIILFMKQEKVIEKAFKEIFVIR
jgi:hypothetical protein